MWKSGGRAFKYNAKLGMLFALRAFHNLDGMFRLWSEGDGVGRLDDFMLEYEENGETKSILVQTRYHANMRKTIRKAQLREQGSYSLRRSFFSYKTARETCCAKGSSITYIIICTNIDFHKSVKKDMVQEVTVQEKILNVRSKVVSLEETSIKQHTLYRFRKEVAEDIQPVDQIIVTSAEKLVTCFLNGRTIEHYRYPFKYYHKELLAKEVVDVKTKKFHQNFIDGKSLSETAKMMRNHFIKKFEQAVDEKLLFCDINMALEDKKKEVIVYEKPIGLKFSRKFGVVEDEAQTSATLDEIEGFLRHLLFAVDLPDLDLDNLIKAEIGEEVETHMIEETFGKLRLRFEAWLESTKGGFISDKELKKFFELLNDFESRYLTDFEPIDCLGKGGFGVVFEAKNKMDEHNYAIKRISLQNSQDSRERVMREVKALAKLDHPNIVRFFNAWSESPPKRWLGKHDQCWINERSFPSSEFSTGLTSTTSKGSDSGCIDESQSNPSSKDSASEAYKLDDHNEESDSYVEFKRSNSREIEETEESNICDNRDSQSDDGKAANKIDEKRTRSLNPSSQFRMNKQKPMKMLLYIQMQLCKRSSLREWLELETETRNTQRILKIFQQIVDAVEYVHLQGLIHRDLKPSNIFFAFDDKVKVGDFGLVAAMTIGCDQVRIPDKEPKIDGSQQILHTAGVGTRLYMAPEQMISQNYDYKVDIYSLGIIFYELLVPFSTKMERTFALRDLRKSIFPPDFPKKHPAEYDLLLMMLDENPKKRPTTLGIKARPPLATLETDGSLDVDKERWHFDLPEISRHSSVTSSSSGESWENINL